MSDFLALFSLAKSRQCNENHDYMTEKEKPNQVECDSRFNGWDGDDEESITCTFTHIAGEEMMIEGFDSSQPPQLFPDSFPSLPWEITFLTHWQSPGEMWLKLPKDESGNFFSAARNTSTVYFSTSLCFGSCSKINRAKNFHCILIKKIKSYYFNYRIMSRYGPGWRDWFSRFGLCATG